MIKTITEEENGITIKQLFDKYNLSTGKLNMFLKLGQLRPKPEQIGDVLLMDKVNIFYCPSGIDRTV